MKKLIVQDKREYQGVVYCTVDQRANRLDITNGELAEYFVNQVCEIDGEQYIICDTGQYMTPPDAIEPYINIRMNRYINYGPTE